MATLSGHASYLEHAAQFNLELEECTRAAANVSFTYVSQKI